MKPNLLLISILLLIFNAHLFSQCECRELIKAFYNETNIKDTTSDFPSDVRSFFGTAKLNNYIQSKKEGKYNFDMPIEGVSSNNPPVDPAVSKMSVLDQLQYSIINGSSNYYNNGWANYMALQVANDSIVNSYNRCLMNCNKGLTVEIASDQKDKVALILKWHSDNIDTAKQVRIDELVFYGVKPVDYNDIKRGVTINSDGKIIIFKRNEGEDLVISVNLMDNKGQKYINLPPIKKNKMNGKDQCIGEWLNVNVNFDSTLIHSWNKCLSARKDKLTANGSDVSTDSKCISLKNMISALTKINEIKNEMDSYLNNSVVNRVQIILEQPRMRDFEEHYNLERAKYLEDKNLVKQPKNSTGVY